MAEDEYIENLVRDYDEVIEEMAAKGYSGGITEAVTEFHNQAESMGVNGGKRDARDALIAFAAKGKITIEQPTSNIKKIYFKERG